MRHLKSMAAAAVVALAGFVSAPALAGQPGFFFDLPALDFNYDFGAGSHFGQITLSESITTLVTAEHWDLGADSKFGGGDDSLIESAGAVFSRDVLATYDVIRLGTNAYRLMGTLSVVDSSGTTVLSATMTSRVLTNDDLVNTPSGMTLVVHGSVFNPTGILRPDSSDSWVFTGDFAGVENAGGDGNAQTITLSDSRSIFTVGSLDQFTVKIGSFTSLDDFFSADRFVGSGTDAKMTVIPSPGAFVLGLIGIGAVMGARRRLAA